MKILHHIEHEHQELLPHIEQLRLAAEAVGSVSAAELKSELQASHEFLSQQLIPHAISEDKVLYPLVARYMGSSGATDLMSYEHTQVVALTRRLEELLLADTPDEAALRQVLYGLHALVSQHFAKEEIFFLPVLSQQLTSEDDAEAAAAMHRAHAHAH
jgi:iron-sulfur cluster repair protein YtfE (RIC family)